METDTQTGRKTNRQAHTICFSYFTGPWDWHTGRQEDKQTDTHYILYILNWTLRQTHRQAGRQTDRHRLYVLHISLVPELSTSHAGRKKKQTDTQAGRKTNRQTYTICFAYLTGP